MTEHKTKKRLVIEFEESEQQLVTRFKSKCVLANKYMNEVLIELIREYVG